MSAPRTNAAAITRRRRARPIDMDPRASAQRVHGRAIGQVTNSSPERMSCRPAAARWGSRPRRPRIAAAGGRTASAGLRRDSDSTGGERISPGLFRCVQLLDHPSSVVDRYRRHRTQPALPPSPPHLRIDSFGKGPGRDNHELLLGCASFVWRRRWLKGWYSTSGRY